MDGLPPDPYKLLGVIKDADTAAIRSAYRKLVLKCHPDKVIGDETLKAKRTEEFHQIQRAYELLNNEEERTKYDAKARLFALRKEMGKDGGARPDPFMYEVRTAEPRNPESHRSSTMYTRANVYTSTPPRSFEDVSYDAESRGVPRKSSSYDSDRKRASMREEERERDRRERERRYEDEEKAKRKAERRAERDSRGDKQKSRDKDKRRGVEEKTRVRGAYAGDTSEDEYRESRYESRKRRSEEEMKAKMEAARLEGIRQERDRAARAAERDARQREHERVTIKPVDLDPKWAHHDNYASQYIKASQRRAEPAHLEHAPMPSMRRAETFAAPSQRYMAAYAIPTSGYSDDEDAPRRSSGRRETRRASEAPVTRQESASREKSSKSSRRQEPFIVDAPSPPPPSSRKPTLQTHSSAPPIIPSFPRKEPTRSKTQDYPRTEKVPPLPRAATFAGERGRGGHSKLRQEYVSTDSDSDVPTRSPRRSQTPPRRSETMRYNYVNGRVAPITTHRPDLTDSRERNRSESPRGSSHLERPGIPRQSTERPRAAPGPTRSSSYYPPSASPIIVDAPLPSRPKIVRENSRSSVHGSPRASSSSGGAYFHNVNYGPDYSHENIAYSSYPPSSDPYSRRGSDSYPSHHQSGSREYNSAYNTARGGRQMAYA